MFIFFDCSVHCCFRVSWFSHPSRPKVSLQNCRLDLQAAHDQELKDIAKYDQTKCKVDDFEKLKANAGLTEEDLPFRMLAAIVSSLGQRQM